MARYMLVCCSVKNNPKRIIFDKSGFVRYFARADEAWRRAIRWRTRKVSDGAIKVFAGVFDTKKKVWLYP